jgi:hypothetical protein
VLWHSAALRAPHSPVADVSLGGARVYSDDLVYVGARIDVELVLPDGATIALGVRVVRVHILRASGPAFCEVALEFLTLSGEARGRLARVLLPPASQPRVEEEHEDEVGEVEDQHREEGLLEPSSRVRFACGPDGDRHICEQNRDQNELLHPPRP